MTGTRCTCGAGHATFGACVRAKSISYPGVFASRTRGALVGFGDRTIEKQGDRELDYYRRVAAQGIEPAGTQWHQIEAADRASQERGLPWDASTNSFKGEPAEAEFHPLT